MKKDYWKQKILNLSKIFLTILLIMPLLFCIGLYVQKYNNTIKNIFIQCELNHPDYIRVYYDNGTGFSDLQSRYYFFSYTRKTVINERHIRKSKSVRIELHSNTKQNNLEYRMKIYYKGRQCNPHFLEHAIFYNAKVTFLEDNTIVLKYEPQEEQNNFTNIVLDYTIDSSSISNYILTKKISWYQYNYIIANYKKYFLLLGISFLLFLLCFSPISKMLYTISKMLYKTIYKMLYKTIYKTTIFELSLYLYATILIFITIIRIFDNNFWLDECFSIKLSHMSIIKMLHATANDVHPPLYYLILIAITKILGHHGWVYHFTSIIPYLFVVFFTLSIVRKRYGKGVSFLFLTFISLSQMAVQYNIEVRMYSLALAFILFSYYSLLLILEKKDYGYILFVITSLGAAYTHYYALFAVSFFYIAMLIQVLKGKEKLKRLILVYMLTILGYLPWLYNTIITCKRTAESFWMKSYPGIIECLKYYYLSNKIWYSYGMIIITFISLTVIVCRDMGIVTAIMKNNKKIISIFKDLKQVSIESLWSIWGIIASIGTLLIGEAISFFIRPALSYRYIYPVVAVTWLVLCVNINKMKLRKIFIAIIFIISLVVYIPLFRATYIKEKMDNKQCKQTVTQMKLYVSNSDILLSNIIHLAKHRLILNYYMLNIKAIYINSNYNEFDQSQKYWLLWNNSLTEDEITWLHKMEYSIKEIIRDGNIGTYSCYLYELIKE